MTTRGFFGPIKAKSYVWEGGYPESHLRGQGGFALVSLILHLALGFSVMIP